MGFLGSLFGKRKRAEVRSRWPPERVTLELPAVLGWLDSQFGNEMDSERKKLGSVSKDVLDMTRDFQKNIYTIRSKGFEEGDRMYAAVNMIKDTWAKKALMSLSSYHKEINDDAASSGIMEFPEFRDMFHSTMKLMNELNMVPKQRMVLQRYFEKESSRMVDIIRSIGERMEEMRGLINEKTMLRTYNEVEGMIKDFEALKKEIPSLEDKLKDMDGKLEKKKKELSETEEDLSSLENSPKWKDLEKLKGGLERCEKRKDEIENSIIGKLGDFKRLMKLFSHDCRQLSKEEKRLADSLSHSPLKAYMSNDPSAVHNLFKKLLLSAKTDAFKIPEKERGKVDRIRDIVDSGWLAVVRGKYDEADDECSVCTQKISAIKVTAETKETERLAEKAKVETRALRHERAALEEKIREKSHEMKTKKRDISEHLHKELGCEVELL